MLSVKINRDLLYSIIFLVGSLFYLIYLSSGGLFFLVLFFILGFILYGKLNDLIINNELLIFSLFSFLVFGFLGIFSPNYDFNKLFLSLLYIVSCIGYSITLSFNNYNLIISKILFSGFSGFLFFNFIKLGFFSFDSFNNIFHYSSRNVVSAVLIFLLLNIIIISNYRKENLNILYFLVCLVFCILLYGRTGIFISLLLFIYKIITYLKNFISFIFIFIFIFIFLYFLGDFFVFLENNTNLAKGLESPRSLIFNEYYYATFLNMRNIILGSNISQCCQYALLFDGNLHNSFLYAHSRFGFLSLIYMLITTIFVFLTRRFIVIFVYIIILIRYFYDQLGFFGIFDITLYVLLLMSCVHYHFIKVVSNE